MNSIEKIDFSSFLACNILPVLCTQLCNRSSERLRAAVGVLDGPCCRVYSVVLADKNDDNDDGDDLQEKLLVRRHELHASSG